MHEWIRIALWTINSNVSLRRFKTQNCIKRKENDFDIQLLVGKK